MIPSNINSISITLIGGDGGDANAGTNCYHNGGKGARIKGSFIITSASCASGIFTMQPGGILRFIRGRKGTNGTEDGQDFPRGFGGGGSAVLYQAPGTSNWLILLVAGAGGGAHADRGQIGLDCFGGGGFSASLTENGTNGGGTYGGQGGSNGNGGKAGGLIPGDGGGGGGAFSGGGDGSIPGLGGKQGFENGGSGGVIYIGAVLFYGGNGFGGGGAKNIAGGGGGGYSGGGGGSRDGYGAGGGGGSFVSPGAFNVEKMVMIGTDLSDGGSVRISTSAGSNIIAPTRIFVNDNATGSNNGTSWTNAFKSLQDALTAAVGNCATEIWVASGVYYPDEGNGFTDNNRNSSFNIKNGIAIYGGFAGGETNISQRNWNLNKTWLSGDLFKNGLVEGIGNSGRYPNYADNAYHVVSGIQTNETAVLDGFNIAGGNANGGGANNVGGGIYAANSTMVIRNCESRSNLANEGGGLFTYQSNVRLENCILRSNSAITGGGGACLKSNSNAYFLNCIFQANVVGTTTTDGGGGGAVVIEGSSPEFVNCTFSSNYAKTGGAVYNTNNALPVFYNTIMWSNESGNPRISGANPVVSVNGSLSNYFNSLVENATLPAGQNNLPPDYPNFTQIDFPLSPAYVGVLTLLKCSPAIDKGSNGFLNYPVDLAGNLRFVNTTVDLGAYEFQGVNGIYYYRDKDGDRFGNPLISVLACSQPPGYVLDNTDCNDDNIMANPQNLYELPTIPGGTNFCNGVDDNCDGIIDNAYTFYRDADGDGLGNPYVKAYGCSSPTPPAGYVLNANDCNDADNTNLSRILYVNKNATGIKDGSSWQNAFTSLQDALSHPCTSIQQIWVAKGIYYPDEGVARVGASRGETFAMRSNLAIYGGFVGGETSLSLRNWKLNVTTLSGDVDGDGSLVGNSYHVIYNIGAGINNTARLDGFYITGGNASGYNNIDNPAPYPTLQQFPA